MGKWRSARTWWMKGLWMMVFWELQFLSFLKVETSPGLLFLCNTIKGSSHLYSWMLGVSSKKDTHCLRGQVRLPCQERVGISTVEPSPGIKQYHLLRLTLGMHIRHNFQRRVSLHEGHFHVEWSKIDSKDCLGHNAAWEGLKQLHFWISDAILLFNTISFFRNKDKRTLGYLLLLALFVSISTLNLIQERTVDW